MIERHEVNARYAQLVIHGDTLYIAGQIADDYDGDIRKQTIEVLAKIDALLAKGGANRAHLLMCQVWIRDFADYAAYNEVWEKWIAPGTQPARASVGATLLDPRLRIEIAVIASRQEETMPITSSQLLADARAQIREIDISAVKDMLNDPAVVVVDVRDSMELESGMIPGAQHAQRGMLEFFLDRDSDSFLEPLRNRTILIMVCGSGARATLAAKLAQDMGWSAAVLKGGMKAWRAAHE